jgi:uncharacterized protein
VHVEAVLDRPRLPLRAKPFGEDIDFIIENNAGEIAAIEVKAAATLNRRDRRWLEHLRDARPDTFRARIIIHPGAHTTPLGGRIWAVPFNGLWT